MSEHSRFSEAEKQEIEEIVVTSMDRYFKSKGVTVKSILITTATVLGSLAVILGAGKAILGWLGWTYVGQ